MDQSNAANQSPQEPQEQSSRTIWVVGSIVLIALVIIVILALTGVFSPDSGDGGNTGQIFIEISEPVEQSVLDVEQPVIVRGTAGGLFEGGLVVEARDASGNFLAAQPTTVQSPDAGTGGQGPWQVQLAIPVEPGTQGVILAYATSPKDGTIAASDQVQVVFGVSSETESQIIINTPASGAQVDVSQPVIVSGTGSGLFEGNVIVQALDLRGSVLAEQSTTVQAEDAGVGSAGPWSVELQIQLQVNSSGSIYAYSPSPQDGQATASNTVNVEFTFPDAPIEEAFVLEDHLWLLQDQYGVPVLDGTNITAEFDGVRVSGMAGCNQYNASYTRGMIDIAIGSPNTTRAICSEPDGIMEQEAQYLNALSEVRTFSFANGLLQMVDETGDIILTYQAVVLGDLIALEGELAPEAVIIVQLQDVSRADAAAGILGEDRPVNPGAFPVSFVIGYNPEQIDPRFTYAVSARIENSDGELLFTNTQQYPVITGDAPSVIQVQVAPIQ